MAKAQEEPQDEPEDETQSDQEYEASLGPRQPPPAPRKTKWVPIGQGLEAAVMVATPDMCRAWIAAPGIRNRALRPKALKRYTRAMLEGRWRLNGETIIFDEDNNPINGNHRLHSCVAAGVPFETCAIRHVDKTTFPTIDTGIVRQLQDVLSIEGYANAARMGAIAGFFWQIKTLNLSQADRPSDWMSLLQLTKDNEKDLVEAAAAITTMGWQPLRNATFGTLYLLCGRLDAADRDEFFDKLASGAGLEKGDPILKLRARLTEPRHKATKNQRVMTMALAIKVWNAWRNGETITVLAWKISEPFPVPE
jgi:hypothetical protein